MTISTLLFDLDGTLVDTAPDLAYTINSLRSERDLPALEYDQIRSRVGAGGEALVKLGLNTTPQMPHYKEDIAAFLAHYKAQAWAKTRFFEGIPSVLNRLAELHSPYGIVTNRLSYHTIPLLQHLGIYNDVACVVSGDTTPTPKPDPAPLFYACKQMDLDPASCLYIGDDERDIIAGKRAGMKTGVALYGYVSSIAAAQSWQADFYFERISDISAWIDENCDSLRT